MTRTENRDLRDLVRIETARQLIHDIIVEEEASEKTINNLRGARVILKSVEAAISDGIRIRNTRSKEEEGEAESPNLPLAEAAS